MTLRTLAREIRDFPATVVFSLIWIAVFVAMVAVRMQEDPTPTWWRLLVLGIGDGHRFGDLTLYDLARGEWWRLITCTFVHYSLIHITLNLLAFYLLGTLLESWYGTPLFVLIYGVTGAGGNLISALIKYKLASNALIHAGGGSVVVMGQVGLCAVIGWRSRRSMGVDLSWQMVKALVLTGLLGIAFPRYIDNWGHAGGALAGFPLGLLHGWFIRHRQAPSAWGMGLITSLAIAGCVVAQVAADRREARMLHGLRGVVERRAYDVANRGLPVVALLGETVAGAAVVTRSLENVADIMETPPTRLDYHRALYLVGQVRIRPLSTAEQDEFDRLLGRLSCRLLAGMALVLDKGSIRPEYKKIKQLAEFAQTRSLTEEERTEFKQQLEPLRQVIRREQAIRVRELWKQRRAASGTRAPRS